MGQSCCTSTNPNNILTTTSIPNERVMSDKDSEIRSFKPHKKQTGFLYNHAGVILPHYDEFEVIQTQMQFPELNLDIKNTLQTFEYKLKEIGNKINTSETFLIIRDLDKYFLQKVKVGTREQVTAE